VPRETELTRSADGKLFYTPGVYYRWVKGGGGDAKTKKLSLTTSVFLYFRPQDLKSLRLLIGQGENRRVFNNFELLNLNSSKRDPTHLRYVKYLEAEAFLPLNSEQAYWSHIADNMIKDDALPEIANRGLMNVFPVSLVSEELDRMPPSSNLGEEKDRTKGKCRHEGLGGGGGKIEKMADRGPIVIMCGQRAVDRC
jgi:hypothetical protein